jgi:protein-S-isoprenylcysteine O-methyltransferase Ste14
MRVIDTVIGLTWIAFWVYWLASATRANASRRGSRRFAGGRAALAIIIIFLIHSGVFGKGAANHSIALGVVGIGVIAVGLGLAIWARLYLGRNWGMPMTQRVAPELVTGGPYRTIRHPIYTGIVTAMIGTAIAISLFGLIPVVVVGAYFVFSARTEERFLAGEFPETFPACQRSTKMLVPFLY